MDRGPDRRGVAAKVWGPRSVWGAVPSAWWLLLGHAWTKSDYMWSLPQQTTTYRESSEATFPILAWWSWDAPQPLGASSTPWAWQTILSLLHQISDLDCALHLTQTWLISTLKLHYFLCNFILFMIKKMITEVTTSHCNKDYHTPSKNI